MRVLAICIHNGARSQMVEEFLRKFAGDLFDVESAGIDPGEINPAVAALLLEDGIDITGKATRSVVDLRKEGKSFDYVIGVCEPSALEQCPIFPAEKQRLHWPFEDPSRTTGTLAQRIEKARPIRDGIKEQVLRFIEDYRNNERLE